MNNANLSQKQLIEMLQKHNLELTEQCKITSIMLKEKDDLITCYVKALRGKIFEMQKIVDISILSGNNDALIVEKIRKWIISYNSIEHQTSPYINVQELTNLCCGDIINYLKSRYPLLNNDELNICAYICLNFSTDQIRYILNYKHEHSLYNRRHKIKCKISNDSLHELDLILKDMIKDRVY